MTQVLSEDELVTELENRSGLKLRLRLNNNVSTMLSVRRERKEAKVSLHRMFLEAPQPVVHAVASYIRGRRKVVDPVIRAYIQQKISKLDYTHRLRPDKLVTEGKHFNLKELFDQVNHEYFKGQLRLNITWFGRPRRKKSSQLTYGLYYDSLKLVKIHWMLDDPEVPEYFMKYVIYHEMLHHVCPAYTDENGRSYVHSPEFRAREKEFSHYEEAEAYLKQHREIMLG